jgi:hypothetical protein
VSYAGDPLQGVRKHSVPDIVSERGNSNQGDLFVGNAQRRVIRLKTLCQLSGKRQHAEGMLEPRMRSTWEHDAGEAQLPDSSQALKHRRVV